ncbi:XRE family transcriptional regulator [Ignicoccus islandicus DSM 13165]|uniref:XRE family transcriptional regulator n=1 Tax=Ignicoccus islandicus DSM 13165 TaxID=940295 RepID=A0A0U3FNP0_9CREN|nr:multiprotein bridging factor aMBF1 [Ignicoccus islandicus]ALU11951.1 XRE family transcriptional regulator [Ignicoccus islandicus DSM 13165]
MKSKLYCEMCGSPIEGKAYRVVVEGTEMLLCERCYRSVRAKAVPTTTKKKVEKKEERKVEKPKKKVVEYEIVEDYYERVREARERLGMSRAELGMKVGVGENVIKRIELGRLEPDLELAKKLEKALNVKLIRKVEYTEEEGQAKLPSEELTLGDIVVIRKD